jgi:hypothetical protein
MELANEEEVFFEGPSHDVDQSGLFHLVNEETQD